MIGPWAMEMPWQFFSQDNAAWSWIVLCEDSGTKLASMKKTKVHNKLKKRTNITLGTSLDGQRIHLDLEEQTWLSFFKVIE